MGELDFKRLWSAFLPILAASLGTGLILWLFLHYYHLDLASATLSQKVWQIVLLLLITSLTYLGLTKILKIPESGQLLSLVTKRKAK